jgi:hypothetical protein
MANSNVALILLMFQVYEEYKGLGYFRNLVQFIEELKPTDYIFVESVMLGNERMTSILLRNRFQYVDRDSEMVRNYFKRIT